MRKEDDVREREDGDLGGEHSVYRSGLPAHVIHQHILSERVRRREVRLAAADLGDLADEAHEVVVAGQHERIDHDARLAAGGDLGKRLRDDERIETERVAIDPAVGARQGGGFAVGDHHDLAHVLALSLEQSPRQAKTLAGVRVERADADACELADRNLLGRVVEEHDLQPVAGILRADQVGQRERDPLGRREPILAVQDHAVAAVEHQDRRAGALELALDDHQVFVVDLDGVGGPWRLAAELGLACDRVENGGARIQVERIAELVRLRRADDLDAGGQFPRVVAADAAAPERTQQVAQRAVARGNRGSCR